MLDDSTNNQEGWADENMNQNENDKECKSSCYKYKTEKGYLCSNQQKGYLDKKKWCKINKEQVLNNLLTLEEPKKNNFGQYWDYIKEENPQNLCYTNKPFSPTTYKNCDFKDEQSYFWYIFCLVIFRGIVLATMYASMIGLPHLSETMAFAGMSNKEFLETMFDKFKKLINKEYVKKGLLNSESAEKIFTELKDKLLNSDDSDSLQASQFLKEMFKSSRELMKANAATYGDYSTTVVNFLIEKVPTQYLLEALRGGNFVVDDGGEIYNYTSTNMLGYGRFSSHAKNATDVVQMGNTDMFCDAYLHLLSGSFKYQDGRVVSWFQLEGAPMPPGLDSLKVFYNILFGKNINYLNYYIHHAVDTIYYAYYTAKAKLVGGKAVNLALGTSLHTDTNPIYIFNEPVTEELIQKAILDKEFDYKPSNNAFTRNITLSAAIFSNDMGKGINETQSFQQSLPMMVPNATLSSQNNINLLAQPANYAAISMGGKYKKKTAKKKLNKKTKKNKLKIKKSNKKSNKKLNKK
jgi:hypothetical protein